MGHGASIFGGSVACDMAAGQKSALSLPPLVCQTNKCSTKIEGPRKRAWFRRSESYYTDNFTTVLQKLSHTTVTPSRLSPKTRMYVVGKRLHPFLAPRTQVFMECILGITVVPAQGNPYNSRTMSAVTSVASTIVNIRAIYILCKPHLGRIALPGVEHGRRMSVSGDVRNFSSDAIFCRRVYWSPQTFRRLYEALYVGSPDAVGDGERLRGVPAGQKQGVAPDERSRPKERGWRTIVRCETRRKIIQLALVRALSSKGFLRRIEREHPR